MTYKLITEQELQQAIDALQYNSVHSENGANCRACAVTATLRAVQERAGPKLRLTRHHQASMATIEELYSLPEEPK